MSPLRFSQPSFLLASISTTASPPPAEQLHVNGQLLKAVQSTSHHTLFQFENMIVTVAYPYKVH